MTDLTNSLDNQTQITPVTEGQAPQQQATAQVGTIGENSAGVTKAIDSKTPVTESSVAETSSTTPDFKTHLSDDIKNEACLSNIKDLNALAKGYVHAQKELGSRIRIPSSDASAEVKAEFNKKMEAAGYLAKPDISNPEAIKEFQSKLGAGRPTSPDKYEFIAPESLVINEKAVESFKHVAHDLGLTQGQANKLFEFETARASAEFNASKQLTTETLTKEWGNEFDNNINLAKDLLKKYESSFPREVADIRQGQTGNNPLVLKVLAELARNYKETGLISGDRTVSYGLTPGEARTRISEIQNNPQHAYYKATGQEHAEAMKEVETLYAAAYPANKD